MQGVAVLDAVVAVGLQQCCRVVCIRRATLADVLNSMLTVGEAAGVGEEAARTVDRLRARLRRAAGEAARVGSRPKVLVLSSLNPLRTVGRWVPDAAVLGGAHDGLQQAGDPGMDLSWEDVVRYAPDVLIIADVRNGNSKKVFNDLCNLASNPGWWLLPAVKNSAVFVCEKSFFCRAGPRLVDGVEALARMVHGDAMSVCCPTRSVMKLSLRPGQRCRQRLLPNYFMAYC
jgi:ABC-type Fe3+-hydroxamate transport system substrate-binding protein